MLFDFMANRKKTTAVPASALLFCHMHLLIVGDTLFYFWRIVLICANALKKWNGINYCRKVERKIFNQYGGKCINLSEHRCINLSERYRA
jgi:hypothetical protein